MRVRPASLPLWGLPHVREIFLQVALYQIGCHAKRLRLVTEARNPMPLRLAPEPGQLPLGVVAMALLDGFNCSINTQSPRQDGQRLTIAERIERLDRPVAVEQAARLFDKSAG